MSLSSPEYDPVSCRVYDELGLRMMRGTACRLVVQRDSGDETVDAHIEDLYTEGDAEYVRLADGQTIRLDRILRIDDVDAAST